MSEGTRLTLLRHGTTKANQDGLFLGQTDVPLNDHGRLEARALGARMASAGVDVLISSDLIRARDTAQQVAEATGLEVTLDPRFREMHLGDFEEVPAKQVHREHPELIARWISDPGSVRMPGAEAESLGEVQQRAVAGIEAHVAANPGKHLVVVSHTFTLLMVMCWATGLDLSAFRRFHVDRASITRIEWRKFGPTLRGFNDTAHLATLQAAAERASTLS
ncbi:MAG: broad specificity phosphatase PhoE [Myxococcota bacterium]|jgi:broad specificity phosphatase PhoE